MTEKPIQLINRPDVKLTKGQTALYELISLKLSSGAPILYEEAKHIWLTRVCRNVINGIPHKFDYWHHTDDKGEWVSGYTPLKEEQVKYSVFMWLTSNIGALVIKGYLKVIPAIQLAEH